MLLSPILGVRRLKILVLLELVSSYGYYSYVIPQSHTNTNVIRQGNVNVNPGDPTVESHVVCNCELRMGPAPANQPGILGQLSYPPGSQMPVIGFPCGQCAFAQQQQQQQQSVGSTVGVPIVSPSSTTPLPTTQSSTTTAPLYFVTGTPSQQPSTGGGVVGGFGGSGSTPSAQQPFYQPTTTTPGFTAGSTGGFSTPTTSQQFGSTGFSSPQPTTQSTTPGFSFGGGSFGGTFAPSTTQQPLYNPPSTTTTQQPIQSTTPGFVFGGGSFGGSQQPQYEAPSTYPTTAPTFQPSPTPTTTQQPFTTTTPSGAGQFGFGYGTPTTTQSSQSGIVFGGGSFGGTHAPSTYPTTTPTPSTTPFTTPSPSTTTPSPTQPFFEAPSTTPQPSTSQTSVFSPIGYGMPSPTPASSLSCNTTYICSCVPAGGCPPPVDQRFNDAGAQQSAGAFGGAGGFTQGSTTVPQQQQQQFSTSDGSFGGAGGFQQASTGVPQQQQYIPTAGGFGNAGAFTQTPTGVPQQQQQFGSQSGGFGNAGAFQQASTGVPQQQQQFYSPSGGFGNAGAFQQASTGVPQQQQQQGFGNAGAFTQAPTGNQQQQQQFGASGGSFGSAGAFQQTPTGVPQQQQQYNSPSGGFGNAGAFTQTPTSVPFQSQQQGSQQNPTIANDNALINCLQNQGARTGRQVFTYKQFTHGTPALGPPEVSNSAAQKLNVVAFGSNERGSTIMEEFNMSRVGNGPSLVNVTLTDIGCTPLTTGQDGQLRPLSDQEISTRGVVMPPSGTGVPLLVDANYLMNNMNTGRITILDATYSHKQGFPSYHEFQSSEYYGQFENLMAQFINPEYLQDHIPGAVYFNIDIATYPTETQRYTYYPPEAFEQYVQLLGIHEDTYIIVYSRDQIGGMRYAAAVWEMMKIYGHKRISVLNGGLEAWKALGYETVQDNETPPRAEIPKGNFQATFDSRRIVAFEELTNIQPNGKSYLNEPMMFNFMDVRSYDAFNKRGRLSGSKNLPASQLVDSNGFIKSDVDINIELSRANYTRGQSTFVYANDGPEAAFGILAMTVVGQESARLFNGGLNEVRIRAPQLIVR